MTGTSVQATSRKVLWVVRDGVGLALALNLTTTATRSARTNSEIRVMMTKQPVVEPVDVVHDRRDRALKAKLPGRRLPRTGPRHVADRKSGHHRSRERGQPLKHQHRRHCSFDEYRRVASLPHRGRLCRSRPAPDKAPRWGPRSSAGGAARGDFPGFSNHNSGAVAMCLNGCPMRQSGYFAYVAIRSRNRCQASMMQAKKRHRGGPPPLFTWALRPGRSAR